jgi:hypothetical protein
MGDSPSSIEKPLLLAYCHETVILSHASISAQGVSMPGKNRRLQSSTNFTECSRECASIGGTHLMAVWKTENSTRIVQQVTDGAHFVSIMERAIEGTYLDLTFHASRTGSLVPSDYTG